MVTNQHSNRLQLQISNRQILSITLPIAAAMLVPQFNFIINNIFLGGLGEEELGLAGITGVYYLIFAVVGMGLNNGLQTLISRRAGENRIDAIGNLFNNGVVISMVLALAGILLTYLVAPFVFKISLSSPTHVQKAIDFLYIRIWGLPFLYVYQMRNALLVGTNNSKLLIIGTVSEAVANIVFDYGFIYGKLGMPNMGFNGAAVASIISEVMGLVVIFAVMHYKGITKQFQLFVSFSIDKRMTKNILNISSPLILQHAISIISWQFFYILIEHHGSLALAVSNTMRNFFGAFGAFSWAFAITTNTMISNIIGQGLQHRVMELIMKIMKLSLLFSCGVAILLNVLPHLFLSVYGQGTEFVTEAIPVLRVVTVALVLMSVATVWLNAVVGTGNTRMNLISETFAIIIYCVYSYLVLEKYNLPIVFGWMSDWLYWIVLFIPSFWYLRSGRWKHKII